MNKLLALTGAVFAGGLGVAALAAGSAPSFAGPKNYMTGGGPYSIAIGDLTGDGKPDLVTANGNVPALPKHSSRTALRRRMSH